MRLALSPSTSSRLRALTRRRGFAGLALVFLLTGSWLVGDGLYIKAKAGLAQILLDRAWSRTLAGTQAARPWSWADTWPVAKLEVPRLGESSIVLDSVSGQAMAFGPGLMRGPAPGDPGLAIISAHRDTHFRFLKNIQIGDVIIVTRDSGHTITFQITETRIVDANRSGLYQITDTARLALVTCWPFDALQQGSQRFVAIAETVTPQDPAAA